MELMIDDVADMELMVVAHKHQGPSMWIKKILTSHCEQISDSFIVRVLEQCNEEKFGHLGMQVGEEN